MAPTNSGHLLARVNFPIYGVKVLSERHLLVAGGGGHAKTGIANTIEIYELLYDRERDSCRARLITHYDNGSRAIMNVCVINKTDSSNSYLLCCGGGLDGLCTIYDAQLSFDVKRSRSPSNSSKRERHDSEGTGLRRRRASSTSSNKSVRFENGNNNIKPVANGDVSGGHNDKRRSSKPNSSDNLDFPEFCFEITPLKSFQTDYSNDEPFQKVIRYSPLTQLLVTGGADGCIRLWKNPGMKLSFEIAAHKDEVDDLDINPLGTKIASISRDGHGYVWDTESGAKCAELKYQIPGAGSNGVVIKYSFRSCRYGIVEGDRNDYKLFTIINPVVRSKPPRKSYVCKWNTKHYTPEKLVSTGTESLSVMSISDDGRFVGVATLNGSVEVYIAFSLAKLYHMSEAHSIFVTGLEFLQTCDETQQLTGGHDASLVSVSVDNHIVVHHIPKQTKLGFLGSLTFFILFMLLVYSVMSWYGL